MQQTTTDRVAGTSETVSQTARRMLLDGLSTPSSTEEAIDTAIASLLAARDRLGKPAS